MSTPLTDLPRPTRPTPERAPAAGPCPATVQPAAPGSGILRVALVDGESAVVGCTSYTPLRLLVARPRGRGVWVVAASHGGGLLAGDHLALDIAVEAGATACLGTQAETKVYRSSGPTSRQELHARVDEGALLLLLPDPVSCFAGARYRQEQRFELAPGGSLLLVDAFAAGRSARGERWAFDTLRSRNLVARGGRLELSDGLRLEEGDGRPLADRMGDLELLATVTAVGPRLAVPAAALLAEAATWPAQGGAAVLAAVNPLGDGFHLRLGARSVEAGMAFLRNHLAFVSALLGDDPLGRRP
jgi:urease accessory protein